MKYINKVILIVLVMLVPLAGCDTEDLHDLNVNPQASDEIDLNFMFTAALLGTASGGSSGDNRIIDWRTNIGFAAYVVQHLANAGGGIAPGDKYSENFESNEAPFNFFYGDPLRNLSEVLRQTDEGGFAEGRNANLRQAARILKVLNFHRLTDFYGNIPYFNALKGMEDVYFPEYDQQSEIYPDLLKELEEATTLLSANNPDEGFAEADLIYGGDIEKWRRFGNSLMLRLAMRVSNVAPELANEYVAKAVAGGTMVGNEDNFVVPMSEGPSLWVNQNGISRAFFPGDGGQPAFMSKTFVDFLKGDPNNLADVDPRLMILSGGIGNWTAQGYTPTNLNPLEQKGMPNGLDQVQLDALEGREVDQSATYTRINPALLERGDPYILMHHAEVEFLKAEALARGIGSGIEGTVEEHYTQGVRSAMNMYTVFNPAFGVTDANIDAYLAARPFDEGRALEMIGEQMWVSKFFNWWEAWSDWRRTGYPNLTPVNHPSGVTGGQIPRRLRYPSAEAAANPNFAEGATMPDTFTTRVWWDVQ